MLSEALLPSESMNNPIISSTSSANDASGNHIGLFDSKINATGLTSSNSHEFADEYDFCMVFPSNENKGLTDNGENIMKKVKLLGFEVFAFRSHNNQDIFVLLRVPIAKLRTFADKIDFMMQLDPAIAENLLRQGDVEKNIKSVSIPHSPDITALTPFQYIYGRYSQNVDESLYLADSNHRSSAPASPFNELIRLKLSALILESKPPDGGEALKIRRYISRGDLKGCFPLHNPSKLNHLRYIWLSLSNYPWVIPLELIKDYYSEKIAIYFYFIGHLSYYLTIPAFVGIPVQIAVFAMGDNYSAPFIPIYSFFIAIWAIVTLELWKRKESTVALYWGMSKFEEAELDRSEYRGEEILSFVTGEKIKFFPREKYLWYMCQSFTAIFGLILLVISIVTSIYVTRYALTHYDHISESDAQTIASVLNAIQIQVMNYTYSFIAKALADYENHRTDTMYEDSMIMKLFLFQFVNSYASFYYIAFIAEPLGECTGNECMESLAMNLGIIIASRIFTGILTQQVIPYVMFKFKYDKEILSYGDELVRPERESFLESYDVRISSIDEYASVAIQFGYMALFVSALPAAASFVLLSNCVEAKGDAWKLLTSYQRPFPYGCQDIGTWQSIFLLIIVAAVITNAAITVFTMTTFDSYGNVVKFWIFVMFQWICFSVQLFLMQMIPDVPHDVQIQLERTDFIVSKLIDKEEDDVVSAYDRNQVNLKVVINDYPHRLEEAKNFRTSVDNHSNTADNRHKSDANHSSNPMNLHIH